VFFAYQKYGIIMKDELRFLFKTSWKKLLRNSQEIDALWSVCDKSSRSLHYKYRKKTKSVMNFQCCQIQGHGSLEDNLCLRIAWWTKFKFCNLSKLIKSV
jgi:hypothetical protein